METFEEKIGYEFKNKNLLEQALTHSSYAYEHGGIPYNERPEFLGDAVLQLVSSEFLYLNYPDLTEGQLSKFRASLVCEPTLAYCASLMGLGAYIKLGKGEERTGGRAKKSVLSDAMEAVIGALFLDGGISIAKAFITQYILDDVEHKRMFYDTKSALQEKLQAKYKEIPDYRLISESGPSNNRLYTVEVYHGEEYLATGVGSTKKDAEKEAAYKALLNLDRV